MIEAGFLPASGGAAGHGSSTCTCRKESCFRTENKTGSYLLYCPEAGGLHSLVRTAIVCVCTHASRVPLVVKISLLQTKQSSSRSWILNCIPYEENTLHVWLCRTIPRHSNIAKTTPTPRANVHPNTPISRSTCLWVTTEFVKAMCFSREENVIFGTKILFLTFIPIVIWITQTSKKTEYCAM